MFANTTSKIDRLLLAVILLTALFGLVMVFSASVHLSMKHYDQPFRYLTLQGIYLILALIIAAVFLRIPIVNIKKYSVPLFFFTLILLVLVFLPQIGGKVNGAYRWINVGGLFKFQPSELMKLSMILYIAGFIERQHHNIKNHWLALLNAIIVLVIVALLLLLETDIGAFFIISVTALTLIFIAGVNMKLFFSVVLGGASVLFIVIYNIDERWARITAFLKPWDDPYGKGYQTIQSLIGIGRGEWLGVGLGESIQKITFLPDAHTDFIFAIIGEELGVFGMLIVLLIFFFIVAKALLISKQAHSQGKLYSALVAYGIAIWLALQVLINLGVNLALLPTKGLTLPLFSYGGSSLLITMITFAILLRIDIENKTG